MRHSIFVLTFLLSNLFYNNLFAQGEAAVPFLLLQPSPSLSAMGQTGASLPTEDPFGFLWNPAQLGYTSQANNFSFIFYPSSIDWIPAFGLDLKLDALAFNAGYNFKDLIGFPLSFGFGYSNLDFNYGQLGGKDSYNVYSFGLGMDYYVQFSIGYMIKDVTSKLSYISEMGPTEAKAETIVNDFGILLNTPVIKLINKDLLLPIDGKLKGKPTFDFSLGYSKSNIGDDIYYIDAAQADPLPRIDRIGYGISTGFQLISDNFSINAFNLSFTVEADDILITRDSNGNWEYEPTLSDLQFWKNVVEIEGSSKIVSHAGTKLEFVESVALYFGHFSGRGFYSEKTNGYELKAKGLFKLGALWAKDSFTKFLSDHIDIIYYNTNYFEYDRFETKMTGLALYIHNLNEFIE